MNSYFLEDKNKLSLTKDDIFDRIINLKLLVRNTNSTNPDKVDTYIIRSDYEAVFPKQTIHKAFQSGALTNDEYYIRKCTYKPSIKLQYDRKSKDTYVAIDILISNFIIFSPDGNAMATFNKADYDLVGVEVMLGYWGQFKNMPHGTLQELFIFEPYFGADKIVMSNVEYVTVDKLAPDYTLHIHGYINQPLDTKPFVKTTEATYTSASAKKITLPPEASQGEIEGIFKSCITDRYTLSYLTENAIGNISFIHKQVKVYLSENMKNLEIKRPIDSEGNKQAVNLYFKEGGTIESSLNKLIQKLFPRKDIRFFIRNDGNVEVFLVDDLTSVKKLKESFEMTMGDTIFERVYRNQIPAVYNIDINEVAMIVCPFFAFIEPFQEVKFEARYNTSDVVAYYVNSTKNRNSFLAVSIKLSFATVEDVNEMQIYCLSESDTKKLNKGE